MNRAYVLLIIFTVALAVALAVVLVLALLPWIGLIGGVLAGVIVAVAIAGAVYLIRRLQIDLAHRSAIVGLVHLGEHGGYLLQAGKVEPLHPASVHVARGRTFVEADLEPEPQKQIEAPAVAVPTFAELLETGTILHGTTLLLGYIDGDPRQGTWLDLYSCAIAGLQGSGKTTTELFIILQSVLAGAKLLIIDPHRDTAQDSLGGRLAPLASRFLRPVAADNEKDILTTIKMVRREVDRRMHGATGAPIILVVDEFTKLMRRSPAIKDELSVCIEEIAQEGRKMQVFALLSGQIWKATAVGGTELRYSLASSFVHRIQEAQSKLLIPGEYAKLTPKLKPGQVYFYDTNGDTELMQIPYTTEQDVLTVARLLQPTSPTDFQPASFQTSDRLPSTPVEATTDRSLKLVVKPHEATNGVSGALVPSELESKYAEVVELMAQEKKQGEIISIVWGVASGGGSAYQKAAEELRIVQRVIAQQALAQREA